MKTLLLVVGILLLMQGIAFTENLEQTLSQGDWQVYTLERKGMHHKDKRMIDGFIFFQGNKFCKPIRTMDGWYIVKVNTSKGRECQKADFTTLKNIIDQYHFKPFTFPKLKGKIIIFMQPPVKIEYTEKKDGSVVFDLRDRATEGGILHDNTGMVSFER